MSFNVLGVVTLDGLFGYEHAGWEGSAHDSRLFAAAISEAGFKLAEGWNYLADAGYGQGSHLLVSYRGIRYYLKEKGLAQQR